MNGDDIKIGLYQHLLNLVNNKISSLIGEIKSSKESRDSDSKSSAGDKHETSRALVQIEIDKLEVQLDKTLHQEKELSSIHPENSHTQVGQGSLVFTNEGIYFISIGLGKIEWMNEPYFCISLVSPIGKLLNGKCMGDKIRFGGREIEIINVV